MVADPADIYQVRGSLMPLGQVSAEDRHGPGSVKLEPGRYNPALIPHRGCNRCDAASRRIHLTGPTYGVDVREEGIHAE